MLPAQNALYARRILEAMTLSIVVLDRELRLVFMNPAAEMLFAKAFARRMAWVFRIWPWAPTG